VTPDQLQSFRLYASAAIAHGHTADDARRLALEMVTIEDGLERTATPTIDASAFSVRLLEVASDIEEHFGMYGSADEIIAQLETLAQQVAHV